jgi:hypothetical protein
MALPIEQPNLLAEISKDINQELSEENEPTAEQIHAAIDSATAVQHTHISDIIKPTKPKRKFNNVRKRKSTPKAA